MTEFEISCSVGGGGPVNVQFLRIWETKLSAKMFGPRSDFL